MEPIITINGKLLTVGQAMTVRVAIESFAHDLTMDGLGDDSQGRLITEIYLDRISELRELYLPKNPESEETGLG